MIKDFFVFNLMAFAIWWCECAVISLISKFVFGKDILWAYLTNEVGAITTIAIAYLLAIVCWGEYED